MPTNNLCLRKKNLYWGNFFLYCVYIVILVCCNYLSCLTLLHYVLRRSIKNLLKPEVRPFKNIFNLYPEICFITHHVHCEKKYSILLAKCTYLMQIKRCNNAKCSCDQKGT